MPTADLDAPDSSPGGDGNTSVEFPVSSMYPHLVNTVSLAEVSGGLPCLLSLHLADTSLGVTLHSFEFPGGTEAQAKAGAWPESQGVEMALVSPVRAPTFPKRHLHSSQVHLLPGMMF